MTQTPVKHLLSGTVRSSVCEEDWADWRWQYRHQIRSTRELLEQMPAADSYVAARIPGGEAGVARLDARLAESFRFAVTPYYLSLARPLEFADSNRPCPVLAQILPAAAELADTGYPDPDPLAEERYSPLRGITHRYPDRVLWYLSHSCAVYCRYCLRKRKVSRADSAPQRDEYAAIFEYIEQHSEIKEVILSGGDPLSPSDDRLDQILTRLRGVPHLSSIRLHTRMPVTLPQRITPDLCRILERHYPLTLVTHFNHSAELENDPAPARAIRRLRTIGGVTVLNQSVLLKDINDTTADQERLILALLRAGAIPYYLHRCDEVNGVGHFRVPLERGMEILGELRGRNPGIALPRYAVDLPDGGGKIALEPDYLIERNTDAATGTTTYRFWNYERRREFVVTDNPAEDRRSAAKTDNCDVAEGDRQAEE